MLKRIREYFLEREAKRCTRKSTFRSWDDIRSVLLLFESDYQEKNNDARSFIKMLQNEGKRGRGCCYVNKKEAETATLDNYIVLDRKKTNWLGCPHDAVVGECLKEKFDVVMDMTATDVMPLKYMLVRANSDFRCGRSRGETGNKLYDFVMEMPEHPIDPKTNIPRMDYDFIGKMGSQIIKYLKLIKS